MTGSRMRVLVATQSRDRVGGVEAYLEALLPALASRYTVAFLSATTDVTARGPITLPDDVAEIALDRQSNDRLRHARAWQPDVVFAHGLEDPVLERAVVKLAPAVMVEHTYHGTCISSSKTMTRPVVRACTRALGPACLALYLPRGCGGRNPLTMVRLYRTQTARLRTLRSVSGVVTLSAHMAGEVIRNGVRADRVHVVPPFVVDGGASSVQATERPSPTDIRLLYLGRLEPLKGVDRLIEAAPRVARALDRRIRLTIAGDGTARAALERQAASACAGEPRVRIEFPGWQDEQGRARQLALADALVVPSLWPEPFGLVGLEAALAGVPAVAFATGGIPEWLKDGENGCLASSDSARPSDLAAAIVRCVKDGATLQRLRDGARRSAAQWTKERHVARLDQVFAKAAVPLAIGHAS
jgi:glycosyltransferase involved in cell wall biosynthesis